MSVFAHDNSATTATISQQDMPSEGDKEYIDSFPFEKYKVVSAGEQGLFYIDNFKDGLKKVLGEGCPWEPESDLLIRKYVKRNTNALDIGANNGTHTIPLARAVGELGRVFAFEPQKKVHRELIMNLRLNNIHNVVAYQVAIGDENKLVFLGNPVPGNEAARFISTLNKVEPVQMRTIDSLGLSNISFVKIDAENFELEVLKGAFKTFKREKPILLIEIQGNYEQAGEVSENAGAQMDTAKKKSIQFLENMGYNVTHFNCDDYLAIPKWASFKVTKPTKS